MAYSKDFRACAVKYSYEHGREAAVSFFNIGIATITRWRANASKGKYEADYSALRQRPTKVSAEELQAYYDKHTDAYLWEAAKHFGVGKQTICRMCQQHKISRKKRRPSTRNDVKRSEQPIKN